MKCPRCESPVLDERVRDGVTIDACPQCRGVWLDRGELEKLISRALDEQEALGGPQSRNRPVPRRDDDDDDHDDHHDRRDRGHGGGHGRKRSWFDIFD